ncbi:MAG: sulfur carrier protein ThiS [Pseudomonadota bacterium]
MITVNGNSIEWRENMTVTDALAAMSYDFPLITVTVDGTFVPRDEWDTARIPDNAEVKAIHIHHGG